MFGLCGVDRVERRLYEPVSGSRVEQREAWLAEVAFLMERVALPNTSPPPTVTVKFTEEVAHVETELIKTHSTARPPGVALLGFFFIIATLVSGLSAVSLITHAALLEPMWQVKPAAQVNFSHMGIWAPILLAIVCLACASAALGFLTGKKWGHRLGVGILLVNLVGDIVSSLIGDTPGAWVGIPIVSLLLWYLSSGQVKSFFQGAA